MIDRKFASRKFIVVMTGVIGATVLCGFGRIDGGAYMAVTGLCIGAYQWANSMENKNAKVLPIDNSGSA